MKTLCLFLFLVPATVLASGYEKPSLFAARPAALGGVGSVIANPADAVAFNPALVASGKPGWLISLSYSPTTSSLEGPWNNDNLIVSSTPQTSLSAGGLVTYNFNERLGVGFGRYAVGGGKTVYDDVVYRGFSDTLDLYSDIKISEYALGLGYKVSEAWSLGLALRQVAYEASYTRPARAFLGLGIGAPEFKDLTDETLGYRLGIQFSPNPRLKAAFVYRSPVDFRATGFIPGGRIITPLFNLEIAPGEAQMRTTLPQSYTLGTSYRLTKDWQGFFEWSSTNYSTVRTVEIETTSSDVGNRSVLQNWTDQTAYKLGVEFTGWRWPVRFGFNRTSQVTDTNTSNPLTYPPTELQSFTLGTGLHFKIYQNPAQLDLAVDQTQGAGYGAGAEANSDFDNDIRAGNYGIQILAWHLSFTYHFGAAPGNDLVSKVNSK